LQLSQGQYRVKTPVGNKAQDVEEVVPTTVWFQVRQRKAMEDTTTTKGIVRTRRHSRQPSVDDGGRLGYRLLGPKFTADSGGGQWTWWTLY
jgi:hypothetical protein